MADIPVDTDTEQDEQQDDPVRLFMRGSGRAEDDDQGGGWGRRFLEAANSPRIKPMATADDASSPAAEVNPVPPATAKPDSSATMGNAFREPFGPEPPPPAVPPQATSDAARSLGEFAAATGANPAPPPTHLSQVAPPPTPPTMSPEFSRTQEDLRARSAVTPKYDPATGKTLDQYKPSLGSRIGRAFLDFGEGFLHGGLRGAIAAPLKGAFGNKDAPGYFGKGAVSGKYFKDEKARQNTVAADKARIASFEDENKQQQQEFKDKNEVYKDELGQAYKQDVQDIKQQTADEKARQDKALDDLKQQANDLKDQLRSITYDPGSKQFKRGDQVYTPKNFEEGAVLEIQHGIQNGPYLQQWKAERKNQPINIHTGEKTLSARDQLKLRTYMRTRGIKSQDELTDQQLDEALGNKYVDPGDSMLHGEALNNFKNDGDVKSIDDEMKKLAEDRSLQTFALGSADPEGKKAAQSALDGIDQRMKDLAARRNAARDKYVQQQNKRQQPVQPGAPKTQVPTSEVVPKNNPAGIINPVTKKPFQHVATNPKTKAKVGSDDGKNWVAIQ